MTAKFPGTCPNCTGAIKVGDQLTRRNGRWEHTTCAGARWQRGWDNPTTREGKLAKAQFEAQQAANALVEAVVAREVAEDEYFANEYAFAQLDPDRDLGFGSRYWRAQDHRTQLGYAMRDARKAALDEADAAGLIDLHGPVDPEDTAATAARVEAIARFSDAEWRQGMTGLARYLDTITCKDEVYLANNGKRCPAELYRDGRCEDHYWKLQEALQERQQEEEAYEAKAQRDDRLFAGR